ncbi:hypothetical protein C900_05574 [Fulvivirga imtechensis AK7]|uniref:DUF1440 domain-containing protein n=1 Tax=Fulvivirga imtechensis AK7 TaxID=1237149 RepID=L8JJD6_9BACT|nr:hypothetical protein [Fulvivirga imtechensis]ELR69016.1 hypothetical protein C900_05574 [Fulvivirga imtechensis AK7]
MKILQIGAFIGLLDAIAACTNAWFSYGILPHRVWQYVASGLQGKVAYESDILPTILGLIIHFTIAITTTFVFYLLYKKWGHVLRPVVAAGAIYGVGIWLVMNYIVIPFSVIGKYPADVLQITIGLLIHIFVIGIPMAILVKRRSNTDLKPSNL